MQMGRVFDQVGERVVKNEKIIESKNEGHWILIWGGHENFLVMCHEGARPRPTSFHQHPGTDYSCYMAAWLRRLKPIIVTQVDTPMSWGRRVNPWENYPSESIWDRSKPPPAFSKTKK